MRRRWSIGNQRGIALISVLWVGVALGALTAALLALGRSDLDLARNQLDRAVAELAADSAARMTVFALVNNSESAITADGSVVAWRFSQAEVRVEVTPEHGRVDVNHAPSELIAALLQAAGADEPERLAAAIADYMDTDDYLTPDGAERSSYEAAGLPGPKNDLLDHEDELLAVLGMSGPVYSRIADALTVHSGRQSPMPGQEHPVALAALTGDPGALAETTPLPPGFGLELDQVPILLRAGDNPARSDLVRVRAEAMTADGARAARIAVVTLGMQGGSSYSIRAWRSGRSALFPD